MPDVANSPESYIAQLPEEKREVIQQLRQTILQNLPEGFVETINYGMLGYVVPHSIYPSGYHCDPKLPLPFIGLAAQKNHYSFYHMGLYADEQLYEWFLSSYLALNIGKPDIGKSCIRFKHPNKIPYSLMGNLCRQMTVSAWINLYDTKLKSGS